MKRLSPHILLIHPWIIDFAAYNFWIKPLGLLYLAGLLRRSGFKVTLIDCLDFCNKIKKYGDGKFFKTKVEKPPALKSIQRNYSQYGIPEEMLLKRFSMIEEPDLIGITSGMTYWYPGVFKLVEIIKKFFKKAPIILGGIYASLCYDHAKKHSGVDIIFNGRGELEAIELISELTHFDLRTNNSDLRTNMYPSFDLYPQLDFICMSTSKGCPLKCTYCASHFLTDGFLKRDSLNIVDEIEYWTSKFKVKNIAFYDDALLINSKDHFVPIFNEVIKRGILCHFHTPNGLHIKEIDREVADLLLRGGFKTIRLGFETSNQETQIETGSKVDNASFQKAIQHLKMAGYSGEEIGVYIMVGLPGQRVEEAEQSIAFVKESGAKPILVEYSPVPYTPLFEKANQMSPFDLESEPLYHNNSILPCQWKGFSLDDYKKLKIKLREDR